MNRTHSSWRPFHWNRQRTLDFAVLHLPRPQIVLRQLELKADRAESPEAAEEARLLVAKGRNKLRRRAPNCLAAALDLRGDWSRVACEPASSRKTALPGVPY